MNITNLLQVKKFILDNYRCFDMRGFILTPERQKLYNDLDGRMLNRIPIETKPFNTYCFGGMTCKAFGYRTDTNLEIEGMERFAAEKLELDSAQANRLFYYVPDQFKDIWIQNNPNMSDLDRAKLAGERIDYFIATNGRD